MNRPDVNIRELAAWGFDDVARDAPNLDEHSRRARQCVARRAAFVEDSAILSELTHSLRPRALPLLQRHDLLHEYRGLQWDIGVVDLRKLLAFQRRIIIEYGGTTAEPIKQDDWDGLLQLAFDRTRNIEVDVRQTKTAEDVQQIVLRSWNPDLRLCVDAGAANPLRLHGGSPFFEVAHYRGRWFLRDGYHRAYNLIRSGVYAMLAVVIEARSIAEVGVGKPWFFDEHTLFSERPPMVTDFHNDEVALSYSRRRMMKHITVRIEEDFHPASAESL
ncbi:hypothetical protein [Silvibacterium acidisoli]|uniref:hypothetical protein n=1 Tax=Acidobacteriaceae bacterium ZG23-2 TaxID=2883246 RepID=UPI00406BE863